MSRDQLKQTARQVAEELEAAAASAPPPPPGSGGGSIHRGLPEDLRKRFIDVRAVLFQRGIFDPVLARFDTATVPQASTQEIAAELARVADSL
jgi:hypothetical protein